MTRASSVGRAAELPAAIGDEAVAQRQRRRTRTATPSPLPMSGTVPLAASVRPPAPWPSCVCERHRAVGEAALAVKLSGAMPNSLIAAAA